MFKEFWTENITNIQKSSATMETDWYPISKPSARAYGHRKNIRLQSSDAVQAEIPFFPYVLVWRIPAELLVSRAWSTNKKIQDCKINSPAFWMHQSFIHSITARASNRFICRFRPWPMASFWTCHSPPCPPIGPSSRRRRARGTRTPNRAVHDYCQPPTHANAGWWLVPVADL